MPLYEYRCRKCGAQVEKLQKFADRPLSTCEKCGGKLERLVSSSSIQFKGSGWYVTDYARKSASSESGEESGKTASTTEKKSDASSGETKKPADATISSEPRSSRPKSKD